MFEWTFFPFKAVSAPITTTAAATPITFGFGAGSVDTKVGGNLMSKPAPQQQFGSTAGAAKDFSFKVKLFTII